jgi:hypothetical protein
MRTRFVSTLGILFLILTATSWLLTGCYEQPLIPPELKAMRAEYEATAAAFREAGLEEMRAASSGRNVVVVGTVAPDVAPEGAAAEATAIEPPAAPTIAPSPLPSATPAPTTTPTSSATPRLTPTASSTVGVAIKVTTLTPMPKDGKAVPLISPTARVIIVRSKTVVPTTPRATTASPGTVPVTTTLPPISPPGRQPVVDIITEQILGDQVRREVTQTTIKNLAIDLTPEGFTASSHLSLLFGIQRTLNIQGHFAVEHESLVANVSGIRLEGADVTEQYRDQLEDRINWSLYQLLPQRYVKSFALSHDAITVTSEMKR